MARYFNRIAGKNTGTIITKTLIGSINIPRTIRRTLIRITIAQGGRLREIRVLAIPCGIPSRVSINALNRPPISKSKNIAVVRTVLPSIVPITFEFNFFEQLIIELNKKEFLYFSINENLVCFPKEKNIFN
mgnify:CR=1 FL=1